MVVDLEVTERLPAMGPRKSGRARHRQRRTAMTLLEMLLTMALLGVTIGFMGLCIHFYLRTVDARRGDVEQAQLARAILRLMANDIRATILDEPIDLSSVEELASVYDLESMDLEDLPEEFGDIDLDQVESSATEGISDTVATPSVPGLYGNQYELRVDVSHLPRPDEYSLKLPSAADAPADIPSEIKSVAYYLVTNDALGGSTSPLSRSGGAGSVVPASAAGMSGAGQSRGLVRRTLSRAASEWASENGNLDTLRRNTQVLAPEVVRFELRYFDGTEWLLEWDTSEEGGLPVAVEIGIWIQSPDEERRTGQTQRTRIDPADLDTPATAGQAYRLLVDIPAAKPTTEDDGIDAQSEQGAAP